MQHLLQLRFSVLQLMTIIIFIICLLLIGLWLHFEWTVSRFDHIPGPKTRFPFGNVLLLKEGKEPKNLTDVYGELTQRFGKIFTFFLGGTPLVVITDPEVAYEVTVSKFKNFHDRPDILVKTGILWARGKYWASVRAAVQPVFHSQPLSRYAAVMDDAASTALTALKGLSEEDRAFDIRSVLSMAALKIIFKCAYGINLQEKGDELGEAIIKAARILLDPPTSRDPLILFLQLIPRWAANHLAPALSCACASAKHEHARDVMWGVSDALARNYCAVHPELTTPWETPPGLMNRACPVHVPADYVPSEDSIIAHLMQARDKSTKEPLTASQVVPQGLTFILAGYETTSTALSFTIYLLSRNPCVERRLLEEIDSQPGKAPTFETLNDWPYAMACFREALRLFPVAPVTLREAMKNTEIGGYRVPKGTSIHINILGIHLDPNVWENAAEYQPDRFLKDSEAVRSKSYLPFGSGPHNCVGYRFAMEEAIIMLVRLYQNYYFRLSDIHHPDGALNLRVRITMAPVEGVWVTAFPR